MPKLQEILEGQDKILSSAIELGFKSVRLYKSINEGVLGIALDLDIEEDELTADVYDKCISLSYQISLAFNCQVAVISNVDLDNYEIQRIIKSSVHLPCKDRDLINSVFDQDFNINAIDSDSSYNLKMDLYKSVYESFCLKKSKENFIKESSISSNLYLSQFSLKDNELKVQKEADKIASQVKSSWCPIL